MIKQKYFYSAATILALAAIFWIYINLLNYGKSSFSLSVCMIKNISGYPCASCGTTRSVLYFLKGDFYQALFQNPLGIVVSIGILIFPFALLFDLITKKKLLYKVFSTLILRLNTRKYWLSLLLFFIFLWIWNIYKHLNNLDI